MTPRPPRLTVKPLVPARWPDFAALFGERGACGGCWCMLWRLPRREFEAKQGDGNRNTMRALIDAGITPGLLAYRGPNAIGWVSLGPRLEFPGLERSRLLRPIDAMPVWSVTCLFVRRDHRRTGLSVALLRAAIRWVRRHAAPSSRATPKSRAAATWRTCSPGPGSPRRSVPPGSARWHDLRRRGPSCAPRPA